MSENRDERKTYIRERGWFKAGRGLWRCLELSYGWPLESAFRLVREAEAGDMSARRILGMSATVRG